MKKQTKRNSRRGVSLLEVMVTLAIIALVVGLAAPRLMSNFGRAKSQSAEVQMTSVKGALQLFYIDVGRYPSEAEGLQALVSRPRDLDAWNGPYLDRTEDLDDPWGRVLLYRYPGRDGAFDLYSFGRDGHQGGTQEDADIFL
jgi:general secretion pathway protein G